MHDDVWSELISCLQREWTVRKLESDWIGLHVGSAPISVVFTRVGPLVELMAGVCRVAQAAPARMLELARGLSAGGLVSERGAYLLKEVLPLEPCIVALASPAVGRLAAAAARLQSAAIPMSAVPGDLFGNYSM